MAAIDLIVLGIVRQNPLSAYDIQKTVEYRKISKWVKISTPSIYKKVLQLQEKGFIKGVATKQGNMAEKSVYSLTESGQKEFERLMDEVSSEPVNFYLDFNAVISNLAGLSENQKKKYIENIKSGLLQTKNELESNLQAKEKLLSISKEGLAVLKQQYELTLAVEKWIETIL